MTNIIQNNQTSRAINMLRFPLAVLVIVCHCKLLYGISVAGTDTVFPPVGFNTYLQVFCSEVIPHIAVPTFAIISGYLFFLRDKEINLSSFGIKLKKRVKTLLLPYILWCTIAFIITCFKGGVSAPYLQHWLEGLWDVRLWNGVEGLTAFNNFPANMPLWFMRDLFVMVLLTPVTRLIIQKIGLFYIGMLGAWWYSNISAHVTGFSSTIVFFFSMGAWLSLKNIDIAAICSKYKWWIYGATLLIAGIDFWILVSGYVPGEGLHYNWWVFNAYVFLGVWASFALCVDIKNTKVTEVISSLGGTSFFLYAMHALFFVELQSFMYMLLKPSTDIGFMVLYIIYTVAVIAVCMATYYFMKRFLPHACKVLTGNR